MGVRSGSAKDTRRSTGGWLWPLVLSVLGIVLLLDNFLLLGDFNAVALLPLLLVIAGAQILLRGDFLPSEEARRFGITRGSVESATLEINSGEIDVELRPLQPDYVLRDGQAALIAGQFAAQSRPALTMAENYAHLQMHRAATPWTAFADWKISLARDLPWQILASSHIGQLNCDLSDLIVHEVVLATGIGDIRMVSPKEAFRPLHLRSTLGSIHVITPPGCRTRILVETGRMFGVKADATRYSSSEGSVFEALDADEDAPLVEIRISGTFGDAFLA
ncbi:MAG: hypothetical protein SF029_25285 [bacterium]|nr:hypothetical protein [bacterium]